MINTNSFVILGSTMIPGLCLAELQNIHNPVLGNATKMSAIEFVQGYYDHFDRGMSIQHLNSYRTEDRTKNLDSLAITIAGKTGKEPI